MTNPFVPDKPIESKAYSPGIGDDVEVYKSSEGKSKRKRDIVRGRVTGIGIALREGQFRVTFKVPWGETNGWYWPWQLRRA